MRQFLEALFRFIIIKCTISLERPGNNQHKIATICSFKFDTPLSHSQWAHFKRNKICRDINLHKIKMRLQTQT
jgi:hypothetical protein